MPRLLSSNDGSSTSGPTKGGNVSVSDVLDQLGKPTESDDSLDDLDEQPAPKKETKGDKSDKSDGEKPDKDIEDIDDEDLELSSEESSEPEEEEDINVDTPPKLKEIEKLAPGLLKKLPYLEKMIFRDRQYNQLFGGYDDAVEASEKAGVLDNFEKELTSGNSKNLFAQIKQGDEKAFRKLAVNLLPNLFEVDPQAHQEVVSNLFKRVITRMIHVGKSQQNEQVQDAATILSQFIFGDTEFSPPTDGPQNNRNDNRDEELESERKSFNEERLRAAQEDVISRVTNTLRNTISQYIDPKDEMSAFTKRHAIDEALRFIDSSIDGDDDFRRQMGRLWDTAIKEKLSRSSVDRIRTIFLGKAKSDGLLKKAILKARADALKDNVRREDGNGNNAERRPASRRGPVTTGSSAPSNRGNRGAKIERRQGESVLDFLSRDD